jgi:hypothetical protein
LIPPEFIGENIDEESEGRLEMIWTEKDYETHQAEPSRSLIDVIKNLSTLKIEGSEILFVLLSFLDARLTSLCLSLGASEGVPWMRGWGANALLRMIVALAIILYLKMRGSTGLLWFGNFVLFTIGIWNCFMLMIQYIQTL